MSKEIEYEKSNFLEGMMLGGILGAVAGILLAPLTGEETRQKIKAKVEELDLDEVLKRFSMAYDEGRREMEKVKKEMEE